MSRVIRTAFLAPELDRAIAPIGPRERSDLLEALDVRVRTRSSITTSQLPVEH